MTEIKREDIISNDQIKAVKNFTEAMAVLAVRIVDLDKVGYSHIHKVMIKQLNNVVNPIISEGKEDKLNNDVVGDEGYRRAENSDYNCRKVLRDADSDLYYSGWMDCLDFILEYKNK